MHRGGRSVDGALALLVGVLVAVLVPGCGGDEGGAPANTSSTSASSGNQTGSAPASSQRPGRASVAAVSVTGQQPYASTEFGALNGTILFQGTPPARFQLGATSMNECSHHPEVDQRSNQVIVNDGKLVNCFVTLRSGYDEKKIPPPPSTPAHLDQRGCMYVPRVVALQLGQKLEVLNSDPTNHNVHSSPKRNNGVNTNMGAGGKPFEIDFERAEDGIPFQCDIHSWMGACIFVSEHPWFAVTDEQGHFEIRDVPPGTYVVEARHETLTKVQGSVTVTAGKSTGFTLTLGK